MKYSYVCIKCGAVSDVEKKISDPHPRICQHCGGEVRRIFNTLNVKFNVSGFYHTDKNLYKKEEDDD